MNTEVKIRFFEHYIFLLLNSVFYLFSCAYGITENRDFENKET